MSKNKARIVNSNLFISKPSDTNSYICIIFSRSNNNNIAFFRISKFCSNVRINMSFYFISPYTIMSIKFPVVDARYSFIPIIGVNKSTPSFKSSNFAQGHPPYRFGVCKSYPPPNIIEG